MKFIELNNTKLKFFDSLVEAVVEKYLWGKDKPFVVSIRLSSGRYYDVMFASTLERDVFIEKVKTIIFNCYKRCNKEPVVDIFEREEELETRN